MRPLGYYVDLFSSLIGPAFLLFVFLCHALAGVYYFTPMLIPTADAWTHFVRMLMQTIGVCLFFGVCSAAMRDLKQLMAEIHTRVERDWLHKR